ncbi:uncharacterized protein CIMG_00879 [Coccidioides immitis RS]|uniref:Tubulin-specific chaperone A n=4 Tax=Coccidioides immitis TaxID=5501 RepID=J3KHY8_COCIM|nr:uncharacterized protein CIMG_00879 [Coccidioides immitis RS]KMP00775.1 hypothetical protein CIRG_00917 [Coccidioides immitis RMSCC 2394]KMU75566.1 hypothetical protein CISG_04969 [Coccidioides immitis RMSCC 3703]KMU85441.1 hypothetical protein CIHG_03223 [Coccidioides immitis H538.4]TPX26223.1 hypothetical protein DIZ76_011684 [Coccidioides immitis]EAS35525.3 hypothetical protein CIMG_00879 [Coccidioides immitis RS]
MPAAPGGTQTSRLHPILKAVSSLNRLVADEASYHAELQERHEQILKREKLLETLKEDPEEEGNSLWMLKQERMAYDETKRMLPKMEQLVREAVERLEGLMQEERGKENDANETALHEAAEAIQKAKQAVPALAGPRSEA